VRGGGQDQHYYAIASKATILKPEALNIPTDKFKAQFGEEWKDVLAKGRALNALDAKAKLGIDADTLDAKWGKAKKAGKLIKVRAHASNAQRAEGARSAA